MPARRVRVKWQGKGFYCPKCGCSGSCFDCDTFTKNFNSEEEYMKHFEQGPVKSAEEWKQEALESRAEVERLRVQVGTLESEKQALKQELVQMRENLQEVLGKREPVAEGEEDMGG